MIKGVLLLKEKYGEITKLVFLFRGCPKTLQICTLKVFPKLVSSKVSIVQ